MIDSRSPSFTPFGGSDFLMEEIDAFLEHDDSIPPGVDGIYDSEGDTVYLEQLLSVINSDPNLPPSQVCEINVPEKIKSSCEDPPDLELKDLTSVSLKIDGIDVFDLFVLERWNVDCFVPDTVFLLQEVQENEFQDMQLIQKLQDDQKFMKKVEHSSRSKAFEDIISIGSFVEVLILNHYVLVRKILLPISSWDNLGFTNPTLHTIGFSARENMGDIDINTLTMEQYMALIRDNIRSGVVKPEIGNDVDFEIKSQFMKELRRNLFAGTEDEDAHEHFPITLTGAARRWKNMLPARDGRDTIPSLGEVQLSIIQMSVARSEQSSEATTWQGSSYNSDDTTVITNKVDSFGFDMQKLKESIHAIQVGCKIYKEVHLTQECHLKEDGKVVEHVKYIGFLGETINKFMEESNKKQAAFNEWIRKFREDKDSNLELLVNAKMKKAREVKKEPVPRDLPFVNPYVPPIPFLGCLKEQEDEAKAFRMLEGLKKLKINRPLIRTVKRMPEHLKYVKDVFSSKKPIVEEDAVRLNDKCSIVLQNQPPPKENDLGSFTIPCLIGSLNVRNVEMTDMTKKAPKGIIENMLVQIDKFIFPVDFVIMDMVEDPNAPLILGRPLLATAQAHIDVFNKQISLRVPTARGWIIGITLACSYVEKENTVNELCEHVRWKPSQDFTHLIGPPSGLKGLLHSLNATMFHTKVEARGVVLERNLATGMHFKSESVGCYNEDDDE
ncbi:lon protease 2, peroxisomal [Tanacetum coccineum]